MECKLRVFPTNKNSVFTLIYILCSFQDLDACTSKPGIALSKEKLCPLKNLTSKNKKNPERIAILSSSNK